jgi:hypothetical protein
MGMHEEKPTPEGDTLDQELETLLRDEAERRRPDRRPVRGNQELEREDLERGKDKLGRVLGW